MTSGNSNERPNEPLPTWILELLAALLAWLVLLGFVFMYAKPIYQCWIGETVQWSAGPKETGGASPAAPRNKEELSVFVATAVSGLVGAVTAMIMSARIPTISEQRSGLRAAGTALRRSIAPGFGLNWKQWLAVGYVLVYFVLGFVAIATALFASGHSDLVQNFALIAFGVIIAIVQRLFNVSR